jgi:NADPH:quinone reductase
MRAIIVTRHGGPEVLELQDAPDPEPGPGQLLVDVEAAGVNFRDIYEREGAGAYAGDPPFVAGAEGAGTVAAVGDGVHDFSVGDRVAWAAAAGSHAERIVVDEAKAVSVPDGVGTEVAAAAILQGMTAHYLAVDTYAVQPRDAVLVHAAAGGVGSAAVQLGKAAGARVIGVVGGADKARTARELGCDVVIDRREDDIVAAVKEATGGRGADVVYDPVGGDAYAKSVKCIAFEGRIVIVGFASGTIPSPGLNHALVKNYSIVGLHWGLYNQMDPAAILGCHEELTKLATEGAIKPLISGRVTMKDAADAVQRVADGTTTGRLVVIPEGESR